MLSLGYWPDPNASISVRRKRHRSPRRKAGICPARASLRTVFVEQRRISAASGGVRIGGSVVAMFMIGNTGRMCSIQVFPQEKLGGYANG